MTRRRDPKPGPIAVHCSGCHQDRRIDCTMCEIVLHPDGRARMSWTCVKCGARLHPITNPQSIGWLQDIGVPVADWTTIDPWMDQPRDWTPMTVADVEGYITVCRDSGLCNAALRTLIEEAGA